MGTEIERKFLVTSDAWRRAVSSETHYVQGYLSTSERASVRVRVGAGQAFLNIKSGRSSIRRLEYEYPIPFADALEIMDEVIELPVIDKTRYEVRHGGHLWEVDVFAGANAGLVVAEVELAHEDEPFERPQWVGEEVSEDPRYLNINLVHRPFSEWS
ncbi:MAG: CYTH domain-containing protein [Chromatiales bacterium]|jgi:adenylate cyclase